jgi:3-oxoacyl-[acyl-carrier protein] reductase
MAMETGTVNDDRSWRDFGKRISVPIKLFTEMSWQELARKLNDELRAAFTSTKAVVPTMIRRGYGRIICMGTRLARFPGQGKLALGRRRPRSRGSPATRPENAGPAGSW